MGKRKAQDELSENTNTKRNRDYTARMDEERKATFNNQKALQAAIGRAKQKLHETDEFQEAGDDKRIQLEAAVIQQTITKREKKGKFATLPTPRASEPKRQVALYPWDDDDPAWEDLNEDVDETVARDIDELNGDTLNLIEITQEERDHQMRYHAQNTYRENYIRAASVHWRKICSMYRAKGKSLKKKLSLLHRRGFDENGDFAPMKLCSHFFPSSARKLKTEVETQGRNWYNANDFFTQMEIAILINWAYWMKKWDEPVDLPGPAQFWNGVKVDHILQQIEGADTHDRLRARLAWTLVTDNRFYDHIPVSAYRFPLPGISPMSGLPPKFDNRFVLHLTEIGVRANTIFPKYEDVEEEF